MITGHLIRFQDKAGTPYWRIRLDYGKGTDGRRAQPWEPGRYPTERVAQRVLDTVLVERNRQPGGAPGKLTVGELLVAWLSNEVQHSVKPSTADGYESVCRVHLIPAFGHLQARRLTTAQVDAWRKERLAAGMSTRMVALATLHLGQAYAYAIRRGELAVSPTTALRPLRHEHREMAVWTAEQAARFLVAARTNVYHPYWLLALSTGMRRGELLALEWHDCDVDRATLAVRRSLDDTDGLVAGDTKTGRSRIIDLDRTTLATLREHRVRQQERMLKLGDVYRNRELILASVVGGYISPRNVTREMEHILAHVDVPRIRVHDLRHTAATLMLAAGVPVKVVSERLGHASVTITLSIYAHVLPGMQAQAAETLRRVLAGEA